MTSEQLQKEKVDLYGLPIIVALDVAKVVVLIVAFHFTGGLL